MITTTDEQGFWDMTFRDAFSSTHDASKAADEADLALRRRQGKAGRLEREEIVAYLRARKSPCSVLAEVARGDHWRPSGLEHGRTGSLRSGGEEQ